MTPQAAVDAIWADICGRSGGDAFLETVDEDIQQEIKDSWTGIIAEVYLAAYDSGHKEGFRQ